MSGASKIYAIDTNPAKFELAKKMGGDAVEFINPKELPAGKTLQQHIIDLSGGWGVDYTFECIGNTQTMRAALECAHRGWGKSVVSLRV